MRTVLLQVAVCDAVSVDRVEQQLDPGGARQLVDKRDEGDEGQRAQRRQRVLVCVLHGFVELAPHCVAVELQLVPKVRAGHSDLDRVFVGANVAVWVAHNTILRRNSNKLRPYQRMAAPNFLLCLDLLGGRSAAGAADCRAEIFFFLLAYIGRDRTHADLWTKQKRARSFSFSKQKCVCPEPVLANR
eukprot:COSAG06_NODE_858_length_11909_cov_6.018036_7_plen_187_part_00